MTDFDSDESRLITLTADIVSAYVSNNHVQSGELPNPSYSSGIGVRCVLG